MVMLTLTAIETKPGSAAANTTAVIKKLLWTK